MSSGSRPYVSVAFTNRNDGYGGDLDARIEKFIAYYGLYAAKWPGLFEFVICDWNPPAGRAKLRDAFDWRPLRDVLHIEVAPSVHNAIAGPNSRKMLDYIGRNVAIRNGRGEWSMVLNQDIFVCEGILAAIADRALDVTRFYRADRVDFDFEPCRAEDANLLESCARTHLFEIHRSHDPSQRPISVRVDALSISGEETRPLPGDTYDWRHGIVNCERADWQRHVPRPPGVDWALTGGETLRAIKESDRFQEVFYLHTNASGDFILAPRRAFDVVHGMNEARDFYLHLDGYAITQLYAAGYKQSFFAYPHAVFHADHDRSGRLDHREPLTWPEHQRELSRILRHERPYQINGPDWGLSAFDLPRFHLCTS